MINTIAAAKGIRFPSAFVRCHRQRVRGGLGAAGPGSALLEREPQRCTAISVPAAGWLLGFGAKGKAVLRDIVKAGDPVLHKPADTDKVPPQEIGSEKIQKIIDNMFTAMRKAVGVGLAAPQIGIP